MIRTDPMVDKAYFSFDLFLSLYVYDLVECVFKYLNLINVYRFLGFVYFAFLDDGVSGKEREGQSRSFTWNKISVGVNLSSLVYLSICQWADLIVWQIIFRKCAFLFDLNDVRNAYVHRWQDLMVLDRRFSFDRSTIANEQKSAVIMEMHVYNDRNQSYAPSIWMVHHVNRRFFHTIHWVAKNPISFFCMKKKRMMNELTLDNSSNRAGSSDLGWAFDCRLDRYPG